MEKDDLEADDRKSKKYSHKPDPQMKNTPSNQPRQSQQYSNKRNKKPEMARYQPPGNRLNRTMEKPPLTDKAKQSLIDKRNDATKKVEDIALNQTDLDYTRKSPGLKEENQAINQTQEVSSLENEQPPIRIPIHINKIAHKGGILKLNSAALNEMNKKINNDYNNENSDQMIRQNNNNNDTNPIDNTNFKMLFDPNNPDKPIYVKEKLSNKLTTQQGNAFKRSNRYENKKLNETNYDEIELDNTRLTNTTATKSSNDINKVKTIIQAIKPLEETLGNTIDSFDFTKHTIQAFSSNIMPMRKKLEQLCIDATFTHIETAAFNNIDLNHWRSCYHHLIETLRKELNNLNNNYDQARNEKQINAVSNELKSYLEDGNRFYTKFVEKLEEYFLKFNSNDLATLNYSNSLESIKIACQVDMTIKTKNMKLALMCINRCLIAMGDLARYEEMIFSTSLSAALLTTSCSSNSPSSSNCSSVDSSLKNNPIQRDYSVARFYYLKAMSLAPKSSRAYHQLAILAVYTKRRLDACYYYFRCLEVNIPLSSVRQTLNSLFDEARVKSDAISKFINNAILNKQKHALKFEKSESSHRIETWFKPGMFSSVNTNESNLKTKRSNRVKSTNLSIESEITRDYSSQSSDTSELDEISTDDDQDLDDNDNKKLSTTELNKRFMHNYLNTIGKLFTKVGMETYHEVCSRMLHEFKELLRRKPCPLQKMRLLQITVINISLIDLLFKSQKSNQADQFTQRSQLVESAVQLSIDMFVLISKRFTYLLSNYYEKNSQDFLANESESEENKTWRQLFPSIKIFIDWMLCNSKLWQPLPDQLPPDLGPVLDTWQIIADMLNLVYKLLNVVTMQGPNKCDIISGKIKLEEDLELVGFVPLLSLPCEFDPKVDKTIDLSCLTDFRIAQVRDKKRMEKLCLFADYLCGLEQPYLKYDVVNKCYVPIIRKPINNNKQIKRLLTDNRTTSICSNNSSTSSFKSNDLDILSNNLDELNMLNSDEDQDTDENKFDDVESEESNDFNQLKERHRILKEKITNQEKLSQNVLDTSMRRIELEIRPKFVVPDTNCFIDHLDLIDKLLSTNYYILIVPLLVINELDKLSKSISSFNDDSLEHAQYVQRSAKKAIQFLNERFDKRDRNLKAITSQGSVLETIQFRSEELKAKGTNDELILGCCLHFVHDNARDFNKTDRIHLYREVVLLTEDRHLRLKSHTRNVPVKNIVHFCRWSNLLDDRRFTNRNKTTGNDYKATKKFIPNSNRNSRYE